MIFITKNKKQVYFCRLTSNHLYKLFLYLQQLGEATKKRFGPHVFELNPIEDFYTTHPENMGYLAIDVSTGEIVSYFIIRVGFLYEDGRRLQSYGIEPNSYTYCTFAPSVADDWQGRGVGNGLFHFIVKELKEQGFRRIILWGGVQSNNERAVKYYYKNGFTKIGQFEFNGMNDDMILVIR